MSAEARRTVDVDTTRFDRQPIDGLVGQYRYVSAVNGLHG
jgi:hypothetical protein